MLRLETLSNFGNKPVDIMDIKKDYSQRGLQIIVKLANIELTPEKPTYEGGTWHVEGQMVCNFPGLICI